MKCNFSYVLFTDECRDTLDGPDGWVKGWIIQDQATPQGLRRQLGACRVIFWAGIVGDTLLDSFKVPEGVKMNYEDNNQQFLSDNFLP